MTGLLPRLLCCLIIRLPRRSVLTPLALPSDPKGRSTATTKTTISTTRLPCFSTLRLMRGSVSHHRPRQCPCVLRRADISCPTWAYRDSDRGWAQMEIWESCLEDGTAVSTRQETTTIPTSTMVRYRPVWSGVTGRRSVSRKSTAHRGAQGKLTV